jgi:hypothetical protein
VITIYLLSCKSSFITNFYYLLPCRISFDFHKTDSDITEIKFSSQDKPSHVIVAVGKGEGQSFNDPSRHFQNILKEGYLNLVRTIIYFPVTLHSEPSQYWILVLLLISKHCHMVLFWQIKHTLSYASHQNGDFLTSCKLDNRWFIHFK